MSNHHEVNSFAASFVQMAKAYEELPNVQRQLEEMIDAHSRAQDTIQRLELKLIDRNTTIENLHNDIRKAEADRDDAELRFLEADERTTKALAFIKEQFGSAGSLIQALEPPKVVVTQSQVDPTTPVSDPQSSALSSATTDATTARTETIAEVDRPSSEQVVWESPNPEGQSANPLPDATSTADHSASMPNGQTTIGEPVQKADTATTEPSWAAPQGKSDAPFPVTTPPAVPSSATSPVPMSASSENGTPEPKATGPYVGKRYHDWPAYVNLANWLAGGGTEVDYHWRPKNRDVF